MVFVVACSTDGRQLPRDPLSVAADLEACAESLPCVASRAVLGWSVVLPTAIADPQTACPECGLVESLPMLAPLDLAVEVAFAVTSPPLPLALASATTGTSNKRVLSDLGLAVAMSSWASPVSQLALDSRIPAAGKLAIAERVIELGSTDLAPFATLQAGLMASDSKLVLAARDAIQRVATHIPEEMRPTFAMLLRNRGLEATAFAP